MNTSAEHDWTTAENTAARLRDGLKLAGYGTAFHLLRDGMPIDEAAARAAIVDEITTPPAVGGYQHRMRRDPGLRDQPASVEIDPAGGLVFEHGGFRRPVDLGGLIVARPTETGQGRNRITKKAERKRSQRLQGKLDNTRGTKKADYLAHARCCGYLVRNTSMRFNSRGRDQWGTSVTTRIGGIAPGALRGFIDSAGKATLAATIQLSDRAGGVVGVEAMHRGFAREVIDFLNLELEVDIDGIAEQHRGRLDSGFQPIGHWCGGEEAVLRNLIRRRADLNPREIAKWFWRGYARVASPGGLATACSRATTRG